MQPRILLEKAKFDVTIKRLCHQLIEVHNDFSKTVIIGLQPRGIYLARRIQKELQSILKNKNIKCGELDITFYRDDFRKKELIPNRTNIDFIIEDKNVILVDDVLTTGSTLISALKAFPDSSKVSILTLASAN